MKICKIRGENLASLQARFEIDLEDGALANAGVIAIVGPTGAGKSTLIDAVTLALHGDVPRLASASRGRVGDAETGLTFSDPRNIVRRGAVDAFAEVEFIGADHRRYVAKWSVQRARRRQDGALQKATMSLVDQATGQVLGDKVRDVQRIVEQKVGLSFEELCRSVVLPQNDVAAFLRAPAAERGELLEKLTGTGIYSVLSRRAHELAADARAALQHLEDELAARPVLAPDARASLEATRAQRAQDALRTREDHDRAAGEVAWHDEHARLAAGVSDAARRLAEAEAAEVGAAAARDDLARTDAARAIVHVLDHAATTSEALAAATEVHHAALAAGLDLDARAATVAQAMAAAERRSEAARVARAAREPDLQRAARLDVQLEASTLALTAAAAISTQRAEASQSAEVACASLRARRTGLLDEAAAIDRALAERPVHRALVARRDLVAGALARCVDAGLTAERAARDDDEAAEDAVAAVQGAKAAHVELAACAVAEERAHTRMAELGDLLTRTDLPALRDAVAAADALRAALALKDAIADSASGHKLNHEAALADAARAGRALSDAARVDARGRQELLLCDVRTDEARRALERLQASQDLAVHRRALVVGEPCPLCGALDHPRATEAPAEEGAMHEARARVAELARARDEVLKEIADAAAGAASAASELARSEERAARARQLLLHDVDRWRAAGDAGLGVDPASDTVRAAVRALQDDLIVRARALATALDVGMEVATAHDAARAELDSARERSITARAAAAAHDIEVASIFAHQHEKQTSRRAADAAVDLARAEVLALVPGLDGVDAALRADAAGFAARLDADLAACAEHIARAATVATSLQSLDQEHELANEHARTATAAAVESAAATDAIAAHHEALRAERAAVLQEQTPDVVRAALDGELELAAAELERARRAAGALLAARAANDATRALAADGLAAARAAAHEAQSALAAALTEAGLQLADAALRARIDDDTVAAQRGALASLDLDVKNAHAVLGERRRVLQAHEARAPARIDLAVATAKHAAARAAMDLAGQALQAVDVQLLVDDGARAHRDGLAPRVDLARLEAARWERLSDAIGSKDGKKLRGFAQSLTLDVLIGAANRHLDDFAPRFQLQRVHHSDLDLQIIDRDMGDEIRGVHLLSGGETFLVSLAFALGISSLSSQDVTIESLFIDEGFGGLDRRSLERAIGVLEGLHASGRTVAVVSHVPELIERLAAKVRVQPGGDGASTVHVEVD